MHRLICMFDLNLLPGPWKLKFAHNSHWDYCWACHKNKKSHLGHSLRMVTPGDMLDCSLHIFLRSHLSLCRSLSNLNFELIKSVTYATRVCMCARDKSCGEWMRHVTCVWLQVSSLSLWQFSSCKEAQSTEKILAPLIFIAFTLHIAATMMPQCQMAPPLQWPLSALIIALLAATVRRWDPGQQCLHQAEIDQHVAAVVGGCVHRPWEVPPWLERRRPHK